jgi:hypothetical protein
MSSFPFIQDAFTTFIASAIVIRKKKPFIVHEYMQIFIHSADPNLLSG